MAETDPKNVVQKDFADKNVITFMRNYASASKRSDVRSAFIMTVDANNHVDFGYVTESEHHATLMALVLEDAREDIKALIFGGDSGIDSGE